MSGTARTLCYKGVAEAGVVGAGAAGAGVVVAVAEAEAVAAVDGPGATALLGGVAQHPCLLVPQVSRQ